MQDTQSSVMVTCISVLSQEQLHGVLNPVQIVKVPGYKAGVSPGVQHLQELPSVTDGRGGHGNTVRDRVEVVHGHAAVVEAVKDYVV